MAGLLHLVKEASGTPKEESVIKDAARLAGSIGIATTGVLLADKAIDLAGAQMYKAKIPTIMRYAIKKHPELQDVGESKLKQWLMALYTLSPKIASNQELAADALYQIYQYGGNFDLATAKIIADINKGVSGDNVSYLTTGNAISKR